MGKMDANRRRRDRRKKLNLPIEDKKKNNWMIKSVKTYSQNVNGLIRVKRDQWNQPIHGESSRWKLKYLINLMKNEDIDIYLLQET